MSSAERCSAARWWASLHFDNPSTKLRTRLSTSDRLRTGIGRNGAGKTTLLKILSRITEPTEGRAEIHGRVGSLLEAVP